LALFHHGSVLIAVFVAAALSAFASSSSPFVTTAIASESLENKLAELTPYATGLEIRSSWLLPAHDVRLMSRKNAIAHVEVLAEEVVRYASRLLQMDSGSVTELSLSN